MSCRASTTSAKTAFTPTSGGKGGRVGTNRGDRRPGERGGRGIPRRARGGVPRGSRAGPRRDAGLRCRRLSRRAPDAGVLRLGHHQLRRRGTARLLRGARAAAPAARRRRRARSNRPSPPSPVSCSRSRPTWTRATATASRSCASAPGVYRRGMRMHHVRLGKEVRIADALTFMAADRQQADEAFAGDIIGLHNHGTINIGDTFTEGEALMFTGIPNFAPELFRRAVLKDPLRMKALQKGLDQLCEEGATQLFRPLRNNDLILGAVGPLQFDVVAFRLADEYGVTCAFEPVNVVHGALDRGRRRREARAVPRARAREPRARPCRRARLPRAVADQPRSHDRALAGPRVPRDARTPRRGGVKSALAHAARGRLGALRLGQFGIRDHGHGRVLPGVLQAVLERRHRGGGQHVPARDAERARQPRDRAGGAAARRDGGPWRRAREAACVLHPGRRRGDLRPLLHRAGRLGRGRGRLFSGRHRVLGRRDLQRRAARRRRGSTAVRRRLRFRVLARLRRRRAPAAPQRGHGHESGELRPCGSYRGRAACFPDGRSVVAAVHAAVPLLGEGGEARAPARAVGRRARRLAGVPRHGRGGAQVPRARAGSCSLTGCTSTASTRSSRWLWTSGCRSVSRNRA